MKKCPTVGEEAQYDPRPLREPGRSIRQHQRDGSSDGLRRKNSSPVAILGSNHLKGLSFVRVVLAFCTHQIQMAVEMEKRTAR